MPWGDLRESYHSRRLEYLSTWPVSETEKSHLLPDDPVAFCQKPLQPLQRCPLLSYPWTPNNPSLSDTDILTEEQLWEEPLWETEGRRDHLTSPQVSSGGPDVEPVAHTSAGCVQSASFTASCPAAQALNKDLTNMETAQGRAGLLMPPAGCQHKLVRGQAHSSLTSSNQCSPCCLGCRLTPREQADPGLPDPYLLRLQ